MTLSQVSIEILEFLLTRRATLRSNRQSTHDALNVRIERRQDKTLCNDVVFVAQGAWTILMSCEGIIDGCPSLASVLCDNQHTSAAENEACDGSAYMRYVAVDQSKEESCIVSLESGGLHIIHEGACPAVQSTQAEAEVTITLKCSSTLMELTKCAMDVRNFLFNFKLVHPMISLCLSSTCDELDAYKFGEDQFEFASVCHGISMITDPRYFIISDRVQGAPCHHLTPVSEGSFVFLSPSLSTSESRLSLRCVAVATLIPPSKPTQAQVVNPSQLWLSVYGPGSFPLVYPASTPMEAQLNLKHLAKWEDLGLTLADGELEAEPGSSNLPIRDCFTPDLKASFGGCSSTGKSSSPIIHLMLFLKENFKGYTTSAPARLALLNRVRQEFPHICSQQLSRIQKIVHDTLAKLLGSSSQAARKDRATVMKATVPSCVSSLHNIISRSTNDAFRRRCLGAVQASNCIELSDQLSKHFIALCERPHGQQWTEHSQSAVDSQGQFPSEGDDEDGGRVPSDESNLTSSSSSLMPHHLEPTQDTLSNMESEENADFDLLDETRLQHCNSMVADQGTIPGRYSVPQQSPCPSPHEDQPSSYSSTLTAMQSSTLPSMSASSQLPSSSSALPRASLEVPPRSLAVTPSTPQGPPRPLAAAPSTRCSSVASGSSFSSQHCPHDDIHVHDVITSNETEISSRSSDTGQAAGDKEKRDEVQDSDVQMMQESLSGELGNDWFETLMDHDDWMSNEI